MMKACTSCNGKNKKGARFCNDCGMRFTDESIGRSLHDCKDIFEAMKLNDIRTVKKLIRRGCPVNVADDDGYTPLHWAAEYGNLALVQVILKKGADLSARTRSGWNAVDLSKAEGHREVEEFLQSCRHETMKAPAVKRRKTARKK
jgi:ankyrin repeat protein